MAALKAASRMVEAARTQLLVGQCVPCLKGGASKVRVKRLELDTYLLMYFRKDDFIYIKDTDKKCKPGDIVLIQKLPEKLTKLITHELLEVVHSYGDITDPITGKKVVVGQYRDEIERDAKLFGKLPSGFDYEKAPPRGWQEGKKDFSDKETYQKFHVFPKEDPYSVYR